MKERQVEAEGCALPRDFVPLRLVLQGSGAAVELTRPEMVLGRHSQADIRLPLPDVSRRHCRFFFRDGAWHVQDLKSLNGIMLNDEQIEESLLCQGDRLRVGGFTFAVEVQGQRAVRREEMILSITRALPADPNLRRAS